MSSPKKYGQTHSTLWGPFPITPRTKNNNRDDDGIEVSVHTLPKQLQREFQHVFPDQNLQPIIEKIRDPTAEFLAIPTNQRARQDLVATGEVVEMEKDRLLNVFMIFARTLCEKIRTVDNHGSKCNYWADYIDPCSGLPMLTKNCNKVYSEVDGMECCLNYKSYNAGFCKILTHPTWGSAVYPATIFCYAPRQVVVQILQEYPSLEEEEEEQQQS